MKSSNGSSDSVSSKTRQLCYCDWNKPSCRQTIRHTLRQLLVSLFRILQPLQPASANTTTASCTVQ